MHSGETCHASPLYISYARTYILSSHPAGVHTNELSLFAFTSFPLSIVGLPGFLQEYNVSTNPNIVVTTATIIRFFHLIARMNASTFITFPFLPYQILYCIKKVVPALFNLG